MSPAHTATPSARVLSLGSSIIAGQRSTAASSHDTGAFRAVSPVSGQDLPTVFAAATPSEVDAACRSAWEAFYAISSRPADVRAGLLELVAQKIGDLGEDLVHLCSAETGLGPARIVSERERTVGQLRMFAEMIRDGSWVRAAIDQADATRRPIAKPDLRRMLRPIGPVAVFGASNFPLAYSTAGGDTASALAAGCPVVVKGHPSHPGTGEMVARALSEAVTEAGFHPGTFSFLHAGGSREQAVGQEVVRHPCIRSAGFTGSHAGGMWLAREAAARPDPIPVYAEMGSINPVFLLPQALEQQAKAIAEKLFTSITNASGQMCTCPGILFGVRSDGLEAVIRAISDAMNQTGPMTMLSRRIRSGFIKRTGEIMAVAGVEVRGGSPQAGHRAGGGHEQETGFPIRCSAVLFRCTFDTFRRNPTLSEECFGPSALVVVCDNEQQLLQAATLIQGSLTGSIFAGNVDAGIARQIQLALEQRVGRLIFNGVPTGVEVCTSMVHGGPYPSCNMPNSTAVGPMAIERWCRPVAYQNAPETHLPPELRDENPLRITRTVNGALVVPTR